MKYLTKFDTYNRYQSMTEATYPNVSLIKEDKTIHYRESKNPDYHYVGDILYWDGSTLKSIAYPSWDSSLGTAVAVCVIPTAHNVYGNGNAGWISVNGVNSAGTVASGSDTMVWATENVDTPLTNYSSYPTWDNTVSGTVGTYSWGHISSDIFSAGTQNTVDTVSYYKSTSYMIPSPYAENGSFNEDYRRAILNSSGTNINTLSDFNGAENTKTLVGLGSVYVAATACNLYSSEGIGAGNWYLPAAGELGYIIPRLKVIQAALSACGGCVFYIEGTYDLWSSTESYYYTAERISIGGGGSSVGSTTKTKSMFNYVRPFISLS